MNRGNAYENRQTGNYSHQEGRGGMRGRYDEHCDREDRTPGNSGGDYERNDGNDRRWKPDDRANRYGRGDDTEDRIVRGYGDSRGGSSRFGDRGRNEEDSYGAPSGNYGDANFSDNRESQTGNYDQGRDYSRDDLDSGNYDRGNFGPMSTSHNSRDLNDFGGRGRVGSGRFTERSDSGRYQDKPFNDNYKGDYRSGSYREEERNPVDSYGYTRSKDDGYGRNNGGNNDDGYGRNNDDRSGRNNDRFGGMGDFGGEWDDQRDRGFSSRGRGLRGRMIRGNSSNDDDGQRFGGFGNRDSRKCFKCGGPHLARDCTEGTSRFGDPSASADGRRKPVTYIPEESNVDEDGMFTSISKGINFDKYENIPIEVSGNDPPKPISSFDECDIERQLKNNVLRAKYDRPTPIQKWAIPVILKGRDLMGCAQTGSGKTAGFLLPVLTGLLRNGPRDSPLGPAPLALIVGPTRELVMQIYEESRKFSVGTNIKSVVVYGGVSVSHHISKLRDGADVVIATVGRLLDFVRRGIISLKRVQYLILDEADRMLDMGFKDDILSLCFDFGMPAITERQTLLFSATFPEEIQQIAATILNDYIFVAVGRIGGANHDIEQIIELVPLDQKKERLIEILGSQPEETKTIIFVEKKVMSDFLAVILCQNGIRSTSIHGDREQREREEALKTLKSGETPIIVATSVAARGLDIPNIGHVINYDLPKTIDDYVHRIGRTGRCGNIGKATSFYDPGMDSSLARDLQNILAEAQQEVPSWLQDFCHSSSGYQSTDYTKDVRYHGGRRGRFDNNDGNEEYGQQEAGDKNWN